MLVYYNMYYKRIKGLEQVNSFVPFQKHPKGGCDGDGGGLSGCEMIFLSQKMVFLYGLSLSHVVLTVKGYHHIAAQLLLILISLKLISTS